MIKNHTKTAADKTALATKLVLAALSIPLNGRICNFQRMTTSYMPKDIQDDVENSAQVKA